ncbi:hypothetical protein XENTR_v10018551 [Xenopus tropicalis]|nr:hypothetical protein XENTR_v10018551 [Xenopus tropicalis]
MQQFITACTVYIQKAFFFTCSLMQMITCSLACNSLAPPHPVDAHIYATYKTFCANPVNNRQGIVSTS